MTTFRIQPKAETLSNSQWNSYPDVCRKNILLVNARDETQATKLVEAKYRTASKKPRVTHHSQCTRLKMATANTHLLRFHIMTNSMKNPLAEL